jgi:hypothetical protein
MGDRGGVYRALVGRPDEQKPLGRPRHRWEDNIKMELKEVGCGVTGWIEVGQDRYSRLNLVDAVMDLRVS